MGLTERVWDAFANTLKLSDKVDQLTATINKQQTRIEDLNSRVIRLEAALEFAIRTRTPKRIS
jgi:hypothetical protein